MCPFIIHMKLTQDALPDERGYKQQRILYGNRWIGVGMPQKRSGDILMYVQLQRYVFSQLRILRMLL